MDKQRQILTGTQTWVVEQLASDVFDQIAIAGYGFNSRMLPLCAGFVCGCFFEGNYPVEFWRLQWR